MERRRGIVVRDRIPDDLALSRIIPPRQRRFSQLPGGLARGGYRKARPDRFSASPRVSSAASTRLVRALESRQDRRESANGPPDRVATDALPQSPPPTLVHNDFKLDNVMLDSANPGRVEAVLDWEMATVATLWWISAWSYATGRSRATQAA